MYQVKLTIAETPLHSVLLAFPAFTRNSSFRLLTEFSTDRIRCTTYPRESLSLSLTISSSPAGSLSRFRSLCSNPVYSHPPFSLLHLRISVTWNYYDHCWFQRHFDSLAVGYIIVVYRSTCSWCHERSYRFSEWRLVCDKVRICARVWVLTNQLRSDYACQRWVS